MAVVHALLPLVGGWIRDALFVQSLCDAEYARSADEPVENIAHDRGGHLVDQQTAVVIRVFAVAVGCERADKFALSALQVKRSADLVRDVSGVFIVEDVFERYDEIVHRARVEVAVHVIADRDEAHVQQRKYVLKIFADADIVTAETRQILDDHAVDDACAQVIEHALKVRPVEIRAGVAVIGIQPG